MPLVLGFWAWSPIQPETGDVSAEEFACDSQQVSQRQQQGAPQVDGHGLLCRREHGLQPICCMRAAPEDLALLPLVDSLFGGAEALGQHAGCFIAGCDFSAHGGGRAFLCREINMAWLPGSIAGTVSTLGERLGP